MKYTTLGRTGLKVSVVGLGCGGPSRIGQSQKRSEADSLRVVREALGAGINVIDSAEAYGTEAIVGKALREVRREEVIVSTKKSAWGDAALSRAAITQSLEASLKRLGTDYIDIYHVHAVLPKDYPLVRDEVVPCLLDLKREGKIRFLGITEMFHRDSGHAMLQLALEDDCWDVMMAGFNLLNQSARQRVFSRTLEKNIGTLIMFAVRRALSRKERLLETLRDLEDRGLLDRGSADLSDPLGFLVHEGGATNVTDAAYRYCRHEPGVDVVLSGTGDVVHLRENIVSLLREDLPKRDRARLNTLFSRVDDISGD
ncbi:MAG: aldo/keto reductase [Candidatus Hydrogenedentes bacterium]|nr:aldo/keto reductase [Candidatus Hydrogenedentota bacterium]